MSELSTNNSDNNSSSSQDLLSKATSLSGASLLRRFLGMCADFAAWGLLCLLLSWLGANKPVASVNLSAIAFLIACFTLCTIIIESWIAAPLAQVAGRISSFLYDESDPSGPKGLLSCPLCLGMWVGPILAFLGLPFFAIPSSLLAGAFALAINGLVASGVAYFASGLLSKTA